MSMNERIRALTEEAERLPVPDRVRLVEHLLATLDKPDPEIDRAWAEECERRLDRYLRGETTALDADEVLAKYLKP
jgi:putative addiction module component (TIGR02574 family)